MIYQLTKTSVGLSGQIKWNLILNNGIVSDFQLTPIHECIDFNYTKREDTLNYTHVQNLNRLYKKIPSVFFSSVADPILSTGYPVRNKGVRIETHENTYEMGLKRIPYKRYNKQFSFFCPIWCDNKEELNDVEFRVVLQSIKGSKLCEKSIDYSLIKDYIGQFADEVDLDSKLLYISFDKHTSWIKGINVEDGYPQIKNTLGIIDTLKAQERTILETDSMILNQFSDNKIVCGQLFNFNFIFDINDIIIPQFISDFEGESINAYVDVYCKGVKVGLKDIYSNYDFIPKYDIYKDTYTKHNCLDYLKDYTCIDYIDKNKLVQPIFHWSLAKNPDYMFNLYDGCCPTYHNESIKGAYYDSPDLINKEWNPKKNPLSWCKLHTIDPKYYTEIEVSEQMWRLFGDLSDPSWYHIKRQDNDVESFWINNVLYSNKMRWYNNVTKDGSPIALRNNKEKASLYPDMYFNITFVPNKGLYRSISDMDECLDDYFADITQINPEESQLPKLAFFKHYDTCSQNNTISNIRDNEIGKIIYVFFGKSEEKLPYYNMMSLMVFIDGTNYLDIFSKSSPVRYFTKPMITQFFTSSWIKRDDQISPVVKGYNTTNNNPLSVMTSYVVFSDDESENTYKVPGVDKYSEYSSVNNQILYNVRSLSRTLIETLNNAIVPSTIIFSKSVEPRLVDRPQQLSKFGSGSLHESEYYNSNKFTYLFRYDGELQPYFIDTDQESLMFNNVYIVKQYNQQINVKECSDMDMVDFNRYVSLKYSPLYPSYDYFSLRKKKCRYNRYHRGSRRYLGEKSWYKSNELYILPHQIQITYIGSHLDENIIKDLLRKEMNNRIIYNIVEKGNIKEKKNKIFNHFIYPLYDYSYTFDYINNETIDKYQYIIKYTLK